jgi:hypothetical protein
MVPFMMESESLPGYAMRRASLILDRSVAPTARDLLGVSRLPVGVLAGNIAQLTSSTAGVLGTVAELVALHTPIPALMHLMMTLQQREQLLNRIEQGSRFDRELIYPALGKGQHRTWLGGAYCQICAREDEAKFGFPYWRIEWEYAGVAACPIHRVSLTRGCGRCRGSQAFGDGLIFPSTECFCGNLAKALIPADSRDLDIHVRIATILTRAQRSKRFYSDECDLGALFRQRARDLGFTRGALLDRASLLERFQLRSGD